MYRERGGLPKACRRKASLYIHRLVRSDGRRYKPGEVVVLRVMRLVASTEGDALAVESRLSITLQELAVPPEREGKLLQDSNWWLGA